MRWVISTLLAVVVLTAAVPAGDEEVPTPPSCNGSAKALGSKEGRFNTGYSLRCNFRVNSLSLRANKRITRVMRNPKLRPQTDSSFSCRRARKLRHARCNGEVQAFTRIRGSLRVKGGPCGRPRLALEAVFSGVPVCRAGAPCTANVLGAKVSLVPTGC